MSVRARAAAFNGRARASGFPCERRSVGRAHWGEGKVSVYAEPEIPRKCPPGRRAKRQSKHQGNSLRCVSTEVGERVGELELRSSETQTNTEPAETLVIEARDACSPAQHIADGLTSGIRLDERCSLSVATVLEPGAAAPSRPWCLWFAAPGFDLHPLARRLRRIGESPDPEKGLNRGDGARDPAAQARVPWREGLPPFPGSGLLSAEIQEALDRPFAQRRTSPKQTSRGVVAAGGGLADSPPPPASAPQIDPCRKEEPVATKRELLNRVERATNRHFFGWRKGRGPAAATKV